MFKRLIPLILVAALCGCSIAAPSEPTINTTSATEPSEPHIEETTAEPTVETTEASTPALFDPYALIENMTEEELVGQLFLARFPSMPQARKSIEKMHLGGYILFGKEFENSTPDSIAATIQTCQEASTVPLLIAVDEEGGSVCRVSSYPQYRDQRFPSPRKLYEAGGMDAVMDAEEEKSLLLHSLGINVNMAPVCDITTDPSAFMYSRSLGQSPEITGQFATQVNTISKNNGVGCVMKHFPGYGNNTDTHVGIAVDYRTVEELESGDLLPFRQAIQNGCDAILVSHTIIDSIDSQRPASLSAPVIDYLRNNLGFEGVVVTDDLVMQAITDQYGAGESAVMAIAAGCDLLCSSEYEVQYQAVLEAVQQGRLSLWRVREAAARILQWKYELGLLS